MTYYVETCRPDIYTFVYKINVVLMTDVWYLFANKQNSLSLKYKARLGH